MKNKEDTTILPFKKKIYNVLKDKIKDNYYCKAVNPTSPQILSIDRDRIIDYIKMPMTSFLMIPYDVQK